MKLYVYYYYVFVLCIFVFLLDLLGFLNLIFFGGFGILIFVFVVCSLIELFGLLILLVFILDVWVVCEVLVVEVVL